MPSIRKQTTGKIVTRQKCKECGRKVDLCWAGRCEDHCAEWCKILSDGCGHEDDPQEY